MARARKILMINPVVDEMTSRISDEVGVLGREGHTVHILSVTPRPPSRGVVTHVVGKGRPHGVARTALALVQVMVAAVRLSKAVRPDVVHAHSYDGGLIGAVLSKLHGVPLLLEGDASLTARLFERGAIATDTFLGRLAHAVERFIHGQARVIVTRSMAARDDLLRRCKVDAARVLVIPEVVDTRLYRPFPRAAARSFLGLRPDETCIVAMGGPNPQAIDLLLSSMVVLRSKHPKLRLLVVNAEADEYRARASQLGLEGSLTVASSRVDGPQAATWLSAGDVAVSPAISKIEGNGRLFDSMACAVPTVAFDTPVNRESLGDLGVYARRDTADLAARIEEVLSDPGSASRGERMRIRMEIDHSIDRLQSGLATAYSQVDASAP